MINQRRQNKECETKSNADLAPAAEADITAEGAEGNAEGGGGMKPNIIKISKLFTGIIQLLI